YYSHKPNGSPAYFKYPGLKPTGPLPASVDFPLYPQKEPDKFRAVIFADPQPRDNKEVEFVGHDVIEELIGVDAAFGVSLGDIAFDNLNTFATLNQKIALIGIPWYNVIGNHDLNQDSPDDQRSDETFEATYGPNYYSFDYGPTHFMVLDDMKWVAPAPGAAKGFFLGEFGKTQLEWIKNDLAQIPRNQMVVLMMHVPLVDEEGKFSPTGNRVTDRRDLYRLIEKRPFCLSISGHTHYQEHKFISSADGWEGPEKHHHVVNVTVSGSWWSGLPDEKGIPHTTMRDGAPNGYSFLNFDGNKYSIDFKAARRPAEHQMNIYAPDEVLAAETGKVEVVVNVFGGSEKSKVEMKVGAGEWTPLRHEPRIDPYYALLKERETVMLGAKKRLDPVLGYALPVAVPSAHLWVTNLPLNLPLGTHNIQIRTVDTFGRTYTDQRVVRVVETLAVPKAAPAVEAKPVL
ncbi:metallophosphoesterase, partial [bacterium]